jgi:hypothetical protein
MMENMMVEETVEMTGKLSVIKLENGTSETPIA